MKAMKSMKKDEMSELYASYLKSSMNKTKDEMFKEMSDGMRKMNAMKMKEMMSKMSKKSEEKAQDVSIGWFISESCLALGMIGTVTGFLLMLSGAFAEIDLANTSTIQNSLTKMALGMSTALYTTLIGLICSLALKIQLVNVENENRIHGQ